MHQIDRFQIVNYANGRLPGNRAIVFAEELEKEGPQ